jgi:peptidyl-Lys metalloendopeptidase
MLHRAKVCLWLGMVAALCGAPAVSALPAAAPGLSVTIASDKTLVAGAEPALVRVTLRNDGAQDVDLLRWQTPLHGVEADLFDVRLGGQPVAYTGRLYKRPAPRPEDYLRLAPGSSASADVDLSRYYDMSRTGEYSVQYRVPVQDALRGVGTEIAAAIDLGDIESNVLLLGVERQEQGNLLQALDQIGHVEGGSLAPEYEGCSSGQQDELVEALAAAQDLTVDAFNYLHDLPTKNRRKDAAYKTWFGRYNGSRFSAVLTHYSNIFVAFDAYTVSFHCDCDEEDTYAYVSPDQPFNIHLCGLFWDSPTTGIDSQAGTLVHETSHFFIVAGTHDYAYGMNACKRLAASSPTRAVLNADSHEYFAETR